MSLVGQSRKLARLNGMSVLPSTADVIGSLRHVRFVPLSDIRTEKGRQLRRPYRMPSCVIARAENCAAVMDTNLRNLDDLLRDHFRYGVVAILDAKGVRRRFSSSGGCVAGSISDFWDAVVT